jgi:hypothetical protein
MGHREGASRDPCLCLPALLADDIAVDHPGRCLAACVDRRALQGLGLCRVPPPAPGRPAAPPGDVRQRSLDGDRPCRRLAQVPPRPGALRGLRRPVPPACHTRAAGRHAHRTACPQAWRACPLLWKAGGVWGAAWVARERRVKSVFTQSGTAPDGLQLTLLRRSGFRQQVSASVRLFNCSIHPVM